ncbi:RNA methyltransferase, TrmH family [Nitrosomonas cryotolerans]|uniref:RNA methyltransferase, TrmH family n=1 Tax=Nitrosomonas cryotolerans ATCC 49181 TaxID=1131553 RepID=A0A1N6IS33_9PROT|nr:RNA methyltransferase, TrmH family [Nitrosomonas cryotolerans]SIO34816.1 RNA methyltransferase, TrmH family [Nitrosomonas cryotolerans ATCC 49181]
MMQSITSRAHPFFKQLVRLGKSARYRRKDNLTLLDGIHLIQAYCAVFGSPTNLIVSQSGREYKEIKDFLCSIEKIPRPNIFVLSDALFHQVSPVKAPTGIVASISIPELKLVSENKDKTFCVLLETIQDPGNMGSILRSAAAAGVSDVYLSHDCTDAWAPKTLRAAMGAHFILRIHEQSNLVKIAQQFNGTVIATSLQANRSLYQIQLTGSVAFIFGNEGMGLSDDLLQVTDEQIMIPMLGKTESLNAAAAAAICFFERVRQHLDTQNIQPECYHQ